MTVYAHTSALVKVFVDEPHSDEVRELITAAAVVVVSDVAYPELRAALARRRREGSLTSAQFQTVKRTFEAKWRDLLTIPVTAEICREAGDLAERHHLRGFDSIHLASFAEMLRGLQGRDDVQFSSFDEHLNSAARRVARSLR
ncbi:MAG TPA: type II toxin-antitoxin system VapC family toxin [Vicinamibacterales bacterium]|nr:type II toxin-antitoxin system VapC family toxin [Vicinamibacterales bacterium]